MVMLRATVALKYARRKILWLAANLQWRTHIAMLTPGNMSPLLVDDPENELGPPRWDLAFDGDYYYPNQEEAPRELFGYTSESESGESTTTDPDFVMTPAQYHHRNFRRSLKRTRTRIPSSESE